MRNHSNISTEEVVSLLSFSDAEREHVDSTTSKQWQCEDWYLHKAGFITASKYKRVFTRQATLDKNKEENVTKLVEDIALAKRPHMHSQQQEIEPQNAREWGLFHEESACSVLLAIPTTNWNRSRNAFLFQSRNLFLVLVWIIFSNVSVLMVVQTKL